MSRPAKYVLGFIGVAVLGITALWSILGKSRAPLDGAHTAQSLPEEDVQPQPPAELADVPGGVEPRTSLQAAATEQTPPDSDPIPESAPPANGDLQVLVLDGMGQPVPNFPVHLVRGSAKSKKDVQSKIDAVSNDQGIATLVGSAKKLKPYFQPGPKPPFLEAYGLRMGVRANLPFESPPGEEPDFGTVWLTEKPNGPVRLTIPAIAWIDAHMTPGIGLDDQKIWPNWVSVRRAEDRFAGGWRTGAAVENPEQPLRLGPFGLGWELSIDLTRRDRMGSLCYQVVSGPTTPGEVLRVDLEMVPTQVLQGIAVSASGQPFAEAKLRITLCKRGEDKGRRAYPTTDSKGQWSFEVAPDMQGSRLLFEVRSDPREHHGELPVIQRPSGPGLRDVGQVTLHPAKGPEQLLVSGSVLDEAGKPVRRVNVWVYEIRMEAGQQVRAKQPLDRVRAHSDGRFEASTYESVESGMLRVFASCKGYLSPEYQDVPIGTGGMNFLLAKGGSIGARFRIEHEIPKDQVIIRLSGKSSRTLSLVEFAWRENSRFPSLVQGDYAVRIHIRKTDWDLYETTAQLNSAQNFSLGEIDLVGKAQLLKLHFVDAQGQDIAEERFYMLDTEGHGYKSGVATNEQGAIWCVIPANSGPLTVGNRKRGNLQVQPVSGVNELIFTQ
ncbi:MAG: hypothetical protein GY930_10110 [bacterium]|nr:hypothetical protein [bacterium]